MKKHRKQIADVGGQKSLIDVPVDDVLHKIDCHAEYLRVRSINKEVTFDENVISTLMADVAYDYEESQLLESLHEALDTLNEKERRLVKLLYYDDLGQCKTAAMLGISQSTVAYQNQRIISRLKKQMKNWI